MAREGMPFCIALRALKNGERIARAGWNGSGMYVMMLQPIRVRCAPILRCMSMGPDDASMDTVQYVSLPETLVMRTAQGGYVVWLASQTDILAEDWLALSRQEPT